MLSIIIPFFNEEENLPLLYQELVSVLDKSKSEYEIVFVDDGSTDKSSSLLRHVVKNNPSVKLIQSFTRRGKGYALQRGVQESRGEVVAFMDADLQDDPSDLPRFLDKIEEGYELVNGVRQRKDNAVIRTYSKLGNIFLRTFVRSPFSDINCGFKMMKRKVLDEIPFYANNFRFIPIAAFYRGFRVTEISVHNRPRKYGTSKFGMGKVVIGLIDTLTAFFLYEFSERPLHFFGIIGGFFFLIGFVSAAYMSYERLFLGMLLYQRPALQLAILFMVVGIQIIMTGFIGELIVYMNKKQPRV